MADLDVRIVELAPMRVASAYGFGESPETQAWEKILAFAQKNGLGRENARFFGFNNPNPAPGSPNYGYEQWITVDQDTKPEGDVRITEFGGGLYAVTRFKDVNNIGEVWQSLVLWREDSTYRMGHHQWLEELLTEPDVPYEEYEFDLYLPIVE
jgi:DNA gyrase inhibitor GyrI